VLDPAGEPIPLAEVFAQPNKIRTCGGQGFCLYGYQDFSIGWQCPVCVGDLGERAKADAEGRFVIPGLSAKFAHYVVAAAPGFNSDWVGPIYPEKGIIEIELQPRSPERKLYRGRVFDKDGRPVPRASVMVVARSKESVKTWSRKGLDRLVSTDTDGRFVIASEHDFDELFLRIRAEGKAVLMARLDAIGASKGTQVFRMPRSVQVRGRLFRGVDPLAGVELRMVQADREPTGFEGPVATRTDEMGNFTFPAVNHGQAYRLFATTESMMRRGSLPYIELQVPHRGMEMEVDHLYAEPGYSLKGRVVSSDESELPEGIRILVTRPETWDFIPVDVREDGSFEIFGLPRETLNLAFTVPGYHLSAENPNRDSNEIACLLGRMEGDMADFVVVLDPGEAPEEARSVVRANPVELTSAR
jgi:hypothetical protein